MTPKFKRVVLITLDGVGVGALPDAARFGDEGAATLQHVVQHCGGLDLPQLIGMGLGRIPGITDLFEGDGDGGAYGRMRELSSGKDSTAGHWELAGCVQHRPLPTFPDGFPREIMDRFAAEIGVGTLGNVAASGTEIIRRLGAEHCRTGKPIVYTSVDSVFQVAAHEKIIPLDQLYRMCRVARTILDPYRVGRVIARPFVGDGPKSFVRTRRRKDFSLPPIGPTVLDRLQEAGYACVGIGKIHDLFAGRGISRSLPTRNNSHGMEEVLATLRGLDSGLIFCNLIDFDMMHGHRNDPEGFGRALEAFDGALKQLQVALEPTDLLILAADHGCDPLWPGTDHTREYVPLLVWHKEVKGMVDLGTRESMADVAATVAENFGLRQDAGTSFLANLIGD